MSDMFKLNGGDIAKGLVIAVLGAVFATVAQWLNMPGFDFATFQWEELAKIAGSTALLYLTKNFLSTSDGKVLGSIG